MKRKNIRPVRYHLRVAPTTIHAAEEEAALWRLISRAYIDEVMFFVPHAEERSPGLGTAAEHAAAVTRLAPIFDRLRQENIVPSLNLWWTVSFSDFPGYPRDNRDRFDFRWAVSANGTPSRVVACPACPAWQRHIRSMYATYAALKPARIWIDDDVRMTLKGDVQSPCLCDHCLSDLQHRSGRTETSRDAWLSAITADPPNPVRDAWLDYEHSLEREILKGIAESIHAISPTTQVCLMHSTPEIHGAEGRHWLDLVAALGEPAPMFRPSIGPYTESTGIGIAAGYNVTRLTQAALPPNTPLAPEIENYPHSRFGKSVAVVAANLEMAQWLGITDMTFSIFRFGGRLDLETLRDDPWSDLLASRKPRLQAIADLHVTANQLAGIALPWHEDAARHARGLPDTARPIQLFRRRTWDTVLPLMGMAVRHGEGDITALTGEEIDCLNATERQRIFSGAVLLDGRAVDALIRQGAGHLAGADRRLEDTTATLETVTDADFGDFEGDLINLRWTSQAMQFAWQSGARIISHLTGYESEPRGHGVVLFENALGGRIIVVPYDGQAPQCIAMGMEFSPFESPSFLCLTRAAQLRSAIEWAHRGPLPLSVVGQPMVYPFLAKQPNRLFIAAVNLSPDAANDLVFRIPADKRAVTRLQVLTPAGHWRSLRGAEIMPPGKTVQAIRTGLSLRYLETVALLLDLEPLTTRA